MYSASADFLTKIKSNIRKITWSGTITTVGGSTYQFDDDPTTVKGKIISGAITRSICSQSLNVGTAYASTLSMEVVLSGVSRYELYGGEVTISCSIDGALDVIPMGVFTISEANQTSDHINIKAYDNMVKFDNTRFVPALNTDIQTPYKWLSDACTACGVVLGSLNSEIVSLPNGVRMTGFADSVADANTWRDVLSYLAAYLGGYAYIGRDGKLYIGSYSSVSSDTVPSSFRFSSNLSDFRTTYDGLYATYKDGAVQEYVDNTNTGGLVLDLGTNPFLQFSNQTNRVDALQEIIDSWDGIYYVPYSSDMPMVPIYDVGDVLAFTDNQAGAYDIGAITEITYNIGGVMSVKCAGDNPILAGAQDRFTKTLEGMADKYANGQEIGEQNFWILLTENTNSITVGSTKTQVTEIEFEQKTDVQKVGLMFTCEGQLSATAVVDLEITVDDEASYTFDVTEEKAGKGKRIFTADCGFRVLGKGTHTAKVYLTVTDNSLKWSDLV